MNNKRSMNWRIIFAFAAIYLVWGSTYLAALIGLAGIPPLLLASMRFLIPGLVLLAWCKANGENYPSIQSIRKNAFSGILMLAGGTTSVIWAEQYISTGLAAIIVAALPFWFVILDKHQWKNYFSNKLIIGGILAGFAGIILLFGFDISISSSSENGNLQVFSSLLLIVGCISWAIGSLYAKYNRTNSSTSMNVSVQLLAAGLFCLLLSAVLGEWTNFSFAEVPLKAWIALLYMIILGTLVAYMAYIWLLTVRPPAQVGTYAYVNPVIAVMLGWIFADEHVSRLQIIALLIILTGVLLVNIPKYNPPKSSLKTLLNPP